MKVGHVSYDPRERIGVGQGLNSEVWKIDEPQLGGVMVVKEIPKQGNPSAYFEEAQRVFASEHPNVVRIQYASQTSDKICLVMPLYSRGSLSARIETGPLPEKEVVRIGIGVLAGLGHIHAQGYVHFDLKPSNVLFSDAGEPLVADFGQCRILGPLGTTKVPALYANAYPPEAYRAAVGSPQTDIYHAGLLLYRAANGEPHYKRQVPTNVIEHERKTMKGKFPDRDSFLPHVSARLRTIIRKALKVDPADRFQTAWDMRRALGSVALGLDWRVTVAGDVTTWRANRDQQPDLVVELERECADSFGVAVYTERNGTRRKRDLDTLWLCGATAKAAEHHLKATVFPALAG